MGASHYGKKQKYASGRVVERKRNMVVNGILLLILLGTLGYAAWKDWKERIIPNRIHLVLLLIGIVQFAFVSYTNAYYIPAASRIAGLLVPLFILFFICLFNGQMGGGDYKLIVSLGFCLGLPLLCIILAVTCVTSGITCLLMHKKSVPLAVHVFLAVLILSIIIIV